MNIKEIKEFVAESENSEWLSSFNIILSNPRTGLHISLMGVINIIEFVNRQIEGFEKFETLPNEFQNIKSKFLNIKTKIEDLLIRKNTNEYDWRNIFGEITNQPNKFFVFDSPETIFLVELNKLKPSLYIGAFEYLSGNSTPNVTSIDYFSGYVLATIFSNREYNLTKKILGNENKTYVELRNYFEKFIQESETHINQYFNRALEKSKTFANQIDNLKNTKEELIQNLYDNEKNRLENLYNDSANKIKELENTYEEKLRLQKPAEYWKLRSEKLYKEGKSFRNWLICLIIITSYSLYLLLWLTPEGMLLSFIKGDASAIKWSIIYATFVSFMVVGIRALLKAMFSSFHLARDAEEREQLTYFYLSLRKESDINDNDKNLIMQSLFSRSDTGLLKEDSAPTMPGNIIDKFSNQGR